MDHWACHNPCHYDTSRPSASPGSEAATAGRQVVVVDGDPAVGKSTLVADLAAPCPPAPRGRGADCPAGEVVIPSAEDGLADTIRPCVDTAGVDPRTHALTEVRYLDDDGKPKVRPLTHADAAEIEAAVVSVGARLLIVDVLMSYLPGRADPHLDQGGGGCCGHEWWM